jgi:hypothetical protein
MYVPRSSGVRYRFLFLAAIIVFAFSGLVRATVSDLLYGRSWEFMESVGGIAVGDPYRNRNQTVYLPVRCDVSGLSAITAKPTALNSGIVVTAISQGVKNGQILISVNVGAIRRGSNTCLCTGVDVGDIPAGRYSVCYKGSDGQEHFLKTVDVPPRIVSQESGKKTRMEAR